MDKRLVQRYSKYEVQEFDGGYAGFLATYEIRGRAKKAQNILNQKVTKTVGDPRAAQMLLDQKQGSFAHQMAVFNIKN